MNLSDLFTSLSYGELSNLSLAVDGAGAIEIQHQPKIVIAAEEALLRLYGRFLLLQKDLLIETRKHITNYHLIKRFAESNWVPEEEKYPYIKDLLMEPFEGDVLRILEVYDSYGRLLPLNDPEKAHSVFAPQSNMLQVPRPIDGACLGIRYQARHPVLTAENLDDEILLPEVLHGALRAHIAYNVFTAMNTVEATAKAQEHMARYEFLCKEVEEFDLVGTSRSQTNSRFGKRGWI